MKCSALKTTNWHICKVKECYLELQMTTPLVCPMLGVKLTDNDDSVKTTTLPPKHEEAVVDGGSGHVKMIILLLLTGCIGLGAGIFYVAKSPVRRHRVLGLFRRNTGSVLYTRVNDDNDTSLLTVRTRNLDDSDDDDLII